MRLLGSGDCFVLHSTLWPSSGIPPARPPLISERQYRNNEFRMRGLIAAIVWVWPLKIKCSSKINILYYALNYWHWTNKFAQWTSTPLMDSEFVLWWCTMIHSRSQLGRLEFELNPKCYIELDRALTYMHDISLGISTSFPWWNVNCELWPVCLLRAACPKVHTFDSDADW
jgi:hypothetical protein